MLFDLDGTLTDSAPGILAGFRHALASVGAPEPSDELLAEVVGPPMIDTFRRLGFDAEDTDRALAAYFEYYDTGGGWAQNTVFEGIEPILVDLVARGVRLGVATSKSERFAHRILDHFGLAQYFAFIGGASDDLTRRAKADVIAHTLRGLGIAPVAAADGGTADVVMVGDRDHDVDGATRWGIPTVFVGWGYGTGDENAGAAWTVADMSQLAAMLRG
jgi:phosphoglycolate phosphatase